MSKPSDWTFYGCTFDDLGYLPCFINKDDPKPLAEQIHANYGHGGGWQPLSGWTFNAKDSSIKYPGEPKLMPLAKITVRDETAYFYRSAWLAILSPGKPVEVSRVD
jgi:hypothetical protein